MARRPDTVEQRVRTAVRLMKRDGLSARQATRRAGTTTATLRRHYGDAMYKEGARWRVSGAHFDVLSGGRVIPYVRLSPEDASVVGEHWRAVQTWLEKTDPRPLEAFEGVVVAGAYELETDSDAIDELAGRDDLPTDDIGDSP
jgi:AcrR family transcriptional regulator